ncbi:MAG TPA: type II secretion system protein GspJ [Marinobacter sp.]|nr:type II secretion system protein GspJ [Marinobacter sp.]
MNNQPRQKGFTLLEVMIAMAIGAIVMVISYQAFNIANRSVETGRDVLTEINALDRTWQLLAQDLRHVLAPVAVSDPNNFEGAKRLFRGETLREGIAGESLILQLTRGDWFNPTGRLRSDIQQVIYRVDEDSSLWRDYRPDRNLPVEDWRYSDNYLHQRLLDNIGSIEMRFLSAQVVDRQGDGLLEGDDYTQDWDDIWPSNSDSSGTALTLPRALHIRIELTSGTTSERLYELPLAP